MLHDSIYVTFSRRQNESDGEPISGCQELGLGGGCDNKGCDEGSCFVVMDEACILGVVLATGICIQDIFIQQRTHTNVYTKNAGKN